MSKGALQPCDPDSGANGTCCGPVLQPNWTQAVGIVFGVPLIALPNDSQGNPIEAPVHCIDDDATAAFFRDNTVDPGDPVPIVTAVNITRGDENGADMVEFIIDVPDGTQGGGNLHMVVTNPCGCCGLWPGPFDISGG